MHKEAVNQAAIYVKPPVRVSQHDAERQVQMAETLEFCEGRGLAIGAWLGDSKNSREGFRRMMTEATGTEPRLDHVVVWKLSYFAWGLEKSVLAQQKLSANGVRALSVRERLTDE